MTTYTDPVSLTEINVTIIDSAPDLERALQMTQHYERVAYIKAVKGHRAVGGNFDPTRANVTAKFRSIWSERHSAPVSSEEI